MNVGNIKNKSSVNESTQNYQICLYEFSPAALQIEAEISKWNKKKVTNTKKWKFWSSNVPVILSYR